MRTQYLLSAFASIALLGAATLLVATAPSRAMQIHASPDSLLDANTSRADGGCRPAALSRPNLEVDSGYARPTVTARAALRCASDPTNVWKS